MCYKYSGIRAAWFLAEGAFLIGTFTLILFVFLANQKLERSFGLEASQPARKVSAAVTMRGVAHATSIHDLVPMFNMDNDDDVDDGMELQRGGGSAAAGALVTGRPTDTTVV
jgi:hypothetical protein